MCVHVPPLNHFRIKTGVMVLILATINTPTAILILSPHIRSVNAPRYLQIEGQVFWSHSTFQ